MFPWRELLGLVAQGFAHALLSPLLWLVMALMAWRYYRLSAFRNQLLGGSKFQEMLGVFGAMTLGLAGGWLGSLILSFSGITLNEMGITYLWIMAILLMFVHARFICFAYGGGLLILCSLLIGWPAINGPILLALIGVLHLVESVLITCGGPAGALPVWVQHPRTREWLVGYRMEHFWPLPLLLFLAVPLTPELIAAGGVPTPDWWPIFPLKALPPVNGEWLYALVPVVAALGYTDFAVTTSPAVKSRRSGLGLFLYSLILIGLAWGSIHWSWLLWPAALFAPLGHEGLIRLENKREWAGEPLLRPTLHSLQIVLVAPGSFADDFGISPGDRLIRLSGQKITDPESLNHALFWSPKEFTLEWESQGKLRTANGKFKVPGAQRKLGIVPLTSNMNLPIVGPPESLQDRLRRLRTNWFSR